MKVVIETSVLISGSIFWRHTDEQGITYEVCDTHMPVCSALFDILRKLSAVELEVGVVTKTVEEEARDTLDKAVGNVISQSRFYSLEVRHKVMTLQHIIANECLDKMDLMMEETSHRLPIRRPERQWIIERELRPFFRQVVNKTLRYVQPPIPSLVKDGDLRNELADIMVKTIPARGVIYKGFPDERDLVIMAEATLIFRKYRRKEKIYVASRDKHFIPNPVQVGSYLTGRTKYTGELDPTVRDDVAKRFGFIGEHPDKVIDILKTTYARELAPIENQ
jgi:predicted nucleic acid-binding protein